MKSSTLWRYSAVVVLCAMAAQRYHSLSRPINVEKYHASIRDSATMVPNRIEGWIGHEVSVPVQATTLLQPNLIISKRYLNVETGTTAGFLLVHCSDAHDMAGHFPLRCYPAQGWKLLDAKPHDWKVGDLVFTGMEYKFTRSAEIGAGADQTIIVSNFLMRPGGQILRNMDEMMAGVRGAGGQAEGAAQVQVYFDGSTPDEARQNAVKVLLAGYRPVINAILADPSK